MTLGGMPKPASARISLRRTGVRFREAAGHVANGMVGSKAGGPLRAEISASASDEAISPKPPCIQILGKVDSATGWTFEICDMLISYIHSTDARGIQLAERHSTQNGRHDSARLPIHCASIGSFGLMLAALAVMMTGQMANSPVSGKTLAIAAPVIETAAIPAPSPE